VGIFSCWRNIFSDGSPTLSAPSAMPHSGGAGCAPAPCLARNVREPPCDRAVSPRQDRVIRKMPWRCIDPARVSRLCTAGTSQSGPEIGFLQWRVLGGRSVDQEGTGPHPEFNASKPLGLLGISFLIPAHRLKNTACTPLAQRAIRGPPAQRSPGDA
jgi:hypothetical protein